MFIRETRTKNPQTGTVYKKHQLVESYRTNEGPRQRIVMELGSLELDKPDLKRLGALLSRRISGNDNSLLFEDGKELAKLADDLFRNFQFMEKSKEEKQKRISLAQYKKIDINSLTTSFNRSLGPELVGYEFFSRIGLDAILDTLFITDRQKAIIKAQVIARLINPGSELSTLRWLENNSSLPELASLGPIKKNEFYEIGDLLVEKKKEIESKLNREQKKLYGERKLLLFDLTNTYLEGNSKLNELAAYGHSKEKRKDCLLVSLALLVDENGIPIYSEILKGNQSEPLTLEVIMEKISSKDDSLFGNIVPTLVMDRGIATKANIELIESRGFCYVVIERSDGNKSYRDEFIKNKDSFEVIKDDDDKKVFAKLIDTDKGLKVLTFSRAKAYKEASIDRQRIKRFLLEFNKIAHRVESSILRDNSKVNIAIGKLISKYPSVAKYYEISTTLEPVKSKVISLTIKEKESLKERSDLYGCYVILTNHKDLDARGIWDVYMTLTKVENAFKSLKSDLGIRPIHHQKTDRVIAHLFVSVLAYHLLAAIEFELGKKGDRRKWSTIKELLLTHQRSTLIFTDDKENVHHIRISSSLEPEHRSIYEVLGVKDKLKRIHKIIGTL